MRKWVVWAFGALFMFYKYAIEVSPSVMTSELMESFDVGGKSLGNLAATYFYAYMFLQIPAGILVDRYGPRAIATIAILLCGFGSLLFSMADTLFFAEVGRFISGIGAGVAPVNALKLIANWFTKRRFAFMTGLMMSVAMLGAVFGQAPLAKFISLFDWRFSMRITAFFGFALAIGFFLVVRNHAPSHPEIDITSEKIPLSKQLKSVFGKGQAWILSLYSGLAFAPITFFGGLWGVPYLATSYEIPRAVAAVAVSMIFIGFGVGAPVAGWLSDYIGSRKKVMFFGTALALICSLFVLYMPLNLIVLYVLLFTFGVTISCFLLSFTMIREITSVAVAATAIGFMNTFDAFLGSISDPLTGYFLDLNWTGVMQNGAPLFSITAYKLAFLLLPSYLILGLILIFFMKETYKKEHYHPAELP